MTQAILLVLLAVTVASASARAQSLQKLLDGAKGAPAGQKAQPSAAEQKNWTAERLSQFQDRERALNVDELRAELRNANLPETRADEFLGALREIIRNYQVASDTLALIITKESQQPGEASLESVPLPRDDTEADALRDKLAALRTQAQTVSTQVQIDEEFLARQQSALKTASQQVRRVQEELDASDNDAERNRAALQLKLAELQQEAASSAVFLASWRIYADQLDLRRSQVEIRNLQQALSASGLDTIFNKSRTQAAIAQIEKQKAAVLEEIKSAQDARRAVENSISALEQELPKATGEEEKKRLEARIAIARESSEFANRLSTAGQAWLEGLDEALRLWKATLAVAEDPSPAQYVSARKLADQLLAQADPWREQIGRYLQDARTRLDELESQEKSRDPATSKLEEQRLDLVRQRVAQVRDISALFERVVSHAEQMRTESSFLLKQSSVSERVTQGFAEFGKRLQDIWNHELFTTEEKIVGQDGSTVTRMRGISVGKIILALIGLGAGLFIAKTFARAIKNHLGRRFSVDTARAAFLEKILYYFLLALVVLTTLNWLRIPLTAFAFLGGAIAIGVGFGAQTLMNNFISGLILLAEQKIKVGDLIDVDGHLGRVINLGTRCSRVRKFDGVDVLVPNSYLLEKNVINWTLSDQHHRFDFVIGVAYGTPTELVMGVLSDALGAQPEILKEPAASVVFEAFGDNALTFHLYYWLDIGRSDANKVGTELRLRIDRLCREAGVEIAYPQRDIHLHTAKPISVRVEAREDTISKE